MLLSGPIVLADGKVVAPRLYQERPYKGSLEERAQEGIIIFQGSPTRGHAVEDLILRIRVEGDIDHFAWVIPFPTQPTAHKESPQLFPELHAYVEAQLARLSALRSKPAPGFAAKGEKIGSVPDPVVVLSREVVGSYDVATVRENVAGGLKQWLNAEGYQGLPDADDVIGFYRDKGYVFACIKVADTQLREKKSVDLHPLRFTFKTGGRDGIYFPMKMTGLQKEPFDVNLYVFYRYWINDNRSKYGYVHRGFQLRYRDWDTPACQADGGKAYSDPQGDPLLGPLAGRLAAVTDLFRKLHPGERYYLTNIQARQLQPTSVRDWNDDLWLFPYYTGRNRVPFDVRAGGPAASGWPGDRIPDDYDDSDYDGNDYDLVWWLAAGVGLAGLATAAGWWLLRKRGKGHGSQQPL
jgi:hypothetical protein